MEFKSFDANDQVSLTFDYICPPIEESSHQLRKNADFGTSNLADKYLNLLDKCKMINTLTFRKDLDEVKQFIVDPETPTDFRLILGDWLFRKIYIYNKMRHDNITELTDAITKSVANSTNVVIKGLYIHYHHIQALRNIAEHFFIHRFEEAYFLLQMFNDVQLIQTTPYHEILNHFLKWIKQSKEIEQQSNLLDVLLRHFKDNPEVQSIYQKMRFGSNKFVNLYTDDQNAHDEDLTRETLVMAHKLLKWRKEHSYDGSSTLPRNEWKDELEHVMQLVSHIPHADMIIIRAKIDNTRWEGFSIMDLFLALVRYIDASPNAAGLFKRLEEEFAEMDGLCSSGYILRFINVLQGFVPEFTIKIPFRKQLQGALTHQIAKGFQNATEEQVNGSYLQEYKFEYLGLIANIVNSTLPELITRYGQVDVENEILSVLTEISSYQHWSYSHGKVSF